MAAVPLTLVIFFAGAVYLRGWLRHRSMPVWRVCSFFLGLLAIWVAVVSPVASLDSHMLTAHMIQHLLLMTIAPPLIWLGEPLMTARNHSLAAWALKLLPIRVRKQTGRYATLLVHPVFCWLAAAAALVIWHVPAIFRLG